jgi:hypothetical protein
MNIDNLKSFLLLASQSTYASGDESLKKVEADHSTTIEFFSHDFPEYKFHDNYFGGEPYGGREVIFVKQKPVWMMTYYGKVYKGFESNDVYSILMGALRNSTIENPYRGPKLFKVGEWTYLNDTKGEFEDFYGIERIFKGDNVAYQARYLGGLVDQ